MRRTTLSAAVLMLVLAPAAQARGLAPQVQPLDSARDVLVGIRHGGAFMAEPLLRRSGGAEVSPTLGLWRLRTVAAGRVLPGLNRAGVVWLVQPDRMVRETAASLTPDPLTSSEWWRTPVGADAVEPPGPGIPVTVIDTGLDVTHPEFAERPDTVLLNAQRVTDTNEDFHGTAVASVVAAPVNGVGLTGIYPQAALRAYDADLSGHLTESELIAGVEATTAAGRSVINFSLGSTRFDPALQDEIYAAIRSGSVIVASSGNARDQGDPINFPANMSHVLTVAATDTRDRAAAFSSSSLGVDLAAPGVNIPVAVPTLYDVSGYRPVDGTSFSAPMVSGATAWVWTVRSDLDNTQIFEIMRWSARDVGAKGFDRDTGFGVLDIPSALRFAAPAPDPSEPNDDIALVKPGALFREGTAALTTPTRAKGSERARLDVTDDPEDVYRVWIPAHKQLILSLRGNRNVDLQLWKPATLSIGERGAAAKRHLAASSLQTGVKTDTVIVQNPARRGAYYYADVFLGRNVGDASYALTASIAKK